MEEHEINSERMFLKAYVAETWDSRRESLKG